MELKITKILQVLRKSELLGNMYLSEWQVFWCLQKRSHKSRASECRSRCKVGPGPRRAAALALWQGCPLGSPVGKCHHIFVCQQRPKYKQFLLYTSKNFLSNTRSNADSLSSAVIANITQRDSAWFGGVALWGITSSVTRETWLCFKDCSWPTLGSCSLPHF